SLTSNTDSLTASIYTLFLHDALPILDSTLVGVPVDARSDTTGRMKELETFSQYHSATASSTEGGAYSQSEVGGRVFPQIENKHRSEEHTSELQSLRHLVCRLLLEKKK